MLVDVLEASRASGTGGVVVVVGEAGVGKSRLLAELEPVAAELGFRWTWTENVSYGRTEPYRYVRLFAQAIADEHGVDSGHLHPPAPVHRRHRSGDRPPLRRRHRGHRPGRLVHRLGGRGSDMPNDPAEVAATLIDLADRYLERLLATTGPRVVVIDDLHWLDPSSAPMVELLVDATQRAPLVVLAGTDPATCPRWVGSARCHAARSPRARCPGHGPPGDPRRPGRGRRRRGAQPARADRRQPAVRGRDRPAFLEDGTMELRDGRVALVDPTSTRVPITLRAILGARIDGLDPDARGAVGVASVDRHPVPRG